MSTQGLRDTARAYNEGVQPFVAPLPEEVGDYFDRNHEVLTTIYHGNMHYGYWNGPEDEAGFEEATTRLTDLVIDKLAVERGARVLDLGCGIGRPAVRLAERTGAEVVGVSVSAKDVARAGETAAAAGLADKVSFRLADAMELPFEDGSFDAVFALGSMGHMPDRGDALKEVARVLRPGGRVVLTDEVLRGAALEDEEQAYILAMVAATWCAGPPTVAERYSDYCRVAGLELDELSDITEHTKYTFSKIYQGLQSYRAEHGELPEDMAEILEMGEDIDWAEHHDEDQTEGAVIVTAHRAT
ncbi:methyltransferase domain-containing protein [Actinosynnema sp. NPDC047251]|uniref:Putative S-adenosylmethionine-dependent methyltransferase n=1 Tax=Saccharothrix espanaensis (strain ATCC 51144 / DSM 44229 / JCM 9112 / NBRC 15066 / NRRL 15764) TaxID=1179773 RepID=K0K6K0_SACES|nr:methyltransferase domain-containing protein [Saccharothrix espanaensis]CCH33127.1 putative S-adenosylmethionine-dependent methyltransferase [Saccharothrix espanaensis DSM 44229]